MHTQRDKEWVFSGNLCATVLVWTLLAFLRHQGQLGRRDRFQNKSGVIPSGTVLPRGRRGVGGRDGWKETRPRPQQQQQQCPAATGVSPERGTSQGKLGKIRSAWFWLKWGSFTSNWCQIWHDSLPLWIWNMDLTGEATQPWIRRLCNNSEIVFNCCWLDHIFR